MGHRDQQLRGRAAKGAAKGAVNLAAGKAVAVAVLAGLLGLAAPLGAEERAAGAEAEGQAQDHGHGHAHAETSQGATPVELALLTAEVQEKLQQSARGYFSDEDVAPRSLSDWEGEWRSVWPLLQSGKLDPVWEHKAQKGDKTAAEYRAYYETGYRGPIDQIVIAGDQIRFDAAGTNQSGTYVSDGYEILTYEKGNRGVRFIFKKTAGDPGAPGFIQFSDHLIAPKKSDHYHLYAGEDRAALLEEVTNWPTYYPAGLSDDEILGEMLSH